MLVMLLYMMAGTGEMYIQFMYTKRMFQWQMDRYSYFGMIEVVVYQNYPEYKKICLESKQNYLSADLKFHLLYSQWPRTNSTKKSCKGFVNGIEALPTYLLQIVKAENPKGRRQKKTGYFMTSCKKLGRQLFQNQILKHKKL